MCIFFFYTCDCQCKYRYKYVYMPWYFIHLITSPFFSVFGERELLILDILDRIRRCKAASRPTTSWWRCSASDLDETTVLDDENDRGVVVVVVFFFISRLEKKTKPKKNRRMVSQVELLNCLGWTPKKHKKGDAMRFSESVLLGLFIFELNQTATPMKINMDAQNDGLGNVSPFKYNHFWYLC